MKVSGNKKLWAVTASALLAVALFGLLYWTGDSAGEEGVGFGNSTPVPENSRSVVNDPVSETDATLGTGRIAKGQTGLWAGEDHSADPSPEPPQADRPAESAIQGVRASSILSVLPDLFSTGVGLNTVGSGDVEQFRVEDVLELGMEVIEATIPSVPVYTMFGGNYHDDGVIRDGSKRDGTHEDLPYADVFYPVEKVPWVHKKVRKALNHAVNRDEIRDTLFRGQGQYMAVTFFHQSLPGWNEAWLDNFDENYGYDPERAKELLAEVEAEIGQPLDWSNTIYLLTIRPELPELADLGEAILNYWQAVGADVKLQVTELSEWRTHYLSGTMGGVAWTDATLRFDDPRILEIIYYSKNNICCHFFERDEIDEIYERLSPETDLAKRDQLLRDAGDYIYDEYGTLPLFWFPATYTVNPEVVANYPNAGHFPPRDFDRVVAAK